MNKWTKLISIIFLGFISGLPLALSASTFRIWLFENGIDITSIGFLSMVAMPYSLKFLWSPLIDYYSIPFFGKIFGRRKSWIIATQICLAISIAVLGFTNPVENIMFTAIVATIMTFFASTQDIIIDAYRIEILPKEQQGLGVTTFIYGYRIGLLVSGAGALRLSEYCSWSEIYSLAAMIILIGSLIFAFTIKEPESTNAPIYKKINGYFDLLKQLVFDPLKDFTTKPKWHLIILFTMFFKLGDAMAAVVTENFILSIGFDKVQYADIVKIFGLAATIFGTFCGGVMIYRLGMVKSLWISCFLQMITNALFSLLAIIGYDPKFLALTVGAENFASGMGSCVFVAYLGSVCSNNKFTATQYALLSSIAPIGRIFFASGSGYLAKELGWVNFFLTTMVAAVPGMVLLYFITKKMSHKSAA